MSISRLVRRARDAFAQDLRYSLRSLGRAPVFTSAAVACLTLGIAANTTLFSVFDAIVLRSLPFPNADELVSVALRNSANARRTSLRYDEYAELKRNARAFVAIGAHAGREIAITERQDPERVNGRLITHTLLPLLGSRPQLGRMFGADDDQSGSAPIVIISDALWRRRYGTDSSIIGRAISLDGAAHTIVGVMEPGFAYPSSSELWLPIGARLSAAAVRERTVSVVGRLRSGVDLNSASKEIAALGQRIAQVSRSGGAAPLVGDVRSLRGSRFGSDEAIITTAMLGATTFLLLIACANVANLLLTRAVVREREIAVRAALGASRARIAGQLLTEALMISALAYALSVPLVWEALRLVKNAIPPSDAFPYYMEWSLDARTFAFAALTTTVTGVLFGLAPALRAGGTGFHIALKEGSQGSVSSHRGRVLRDGLVVAEIGLALVLLIGTSLFVRTFLGLNGTELGFDTRRIMTMRFYLAGTRYDSVAARLAMIDETLRRVAAIPGVDVPTVSDLVPLDDEGGSSGNAISDATTLSRDLSITYAGIAPRWFAALGVRLRAGRELTDADERGGVPVALVNETMAKTFWPGTSALGGRFRLASDSSRTWYEVVGIAPDIRTVKLDEDRRTPPTVYLPLRSVPTRDYALMVHTSRLPTALSGELRAAIHAADPVVPVFNLWSMEEVRYLSFWMYALWGTMFAVFGGLALLLATIGVYAVIHYAVAQRTREIGVRIALGARSADVMRLVFGQGLMLASIGLGVGLLGALALTRVVESLLLGVSPTDPISFAAALFILCGTATLASFLPAYRATRVDPLIALRDE